MKPILNNSFTWFDRSAGYGQKVSERFLLTSSWDPALLLGLIGKVVCSSFCSFVLFKTITGPFSEVYDCKLKNLSSSSEVHKRARILSWPESIYNRTVVSAVFTIVGGIRSSLYRPNVKSRGVVGSVRSSAELLMGLLHPVAEVTV
jgi:hypothetical protein